MVEHMTDNKLYSECQYRFRKQRSCVTRVLEIMEDFTQLIDNVYSVDVVYLYCFKKRLIPFLIKR